MRHGIGNRRQGICDRGLGQRTGDRGKKTEDKILRTRDRGHAKEDRGRVQGQGDMTCKYNTQENFEYQVFGVWVDVTINMAKKFAIW